jgi:transcriptional regulator with XRE-family HTH domain
VSIAIDKERLRQELLRRGWEAADLAREARLSQATVSAALAGKPIAAKSLGRIARALLRTPAIDIIDSLIVNDGRARFGVV